MYQEQSIIERHARRTLDDLIRPATYSNRVPVDVTVQHLEGEPEPFERVVNRTFEPITPGEAWGRTWGTSWFHVAGVVPDSLAGSRVELEIDIGFHPGLVGFHTEGLVHDAQGNVLHGIHPMRRWHLLGDPAQGGEPFDLYVEGAANPMVLGHHPTPFGDPATAGPLPIYHFNGAWIVTLNTEVWRLAIELEFLLKQAHNVPKDGRLRPRIFAAIAAAMDAIQPADLAVSAAAARQCLAGVLADPGAPNRHLATAIGHAHIDTAWLWPIRETARKCTRTFANQIELMDAYPHYRFGCSQAAQYEMIETQHRALFESIADRIKTGQWVPLGGSWVEADGNLPGGEALIRQHLHGQRYFQEKFGRSCTVGWIPDVFGYPASLPQIMALSGLTHFVTQKLSWNRTNRFPHHTFAWEGLDGTQITTHFPPSDTYNCEIDPYELSKIERGYADHARSNSSLIVFGHGDGGGGPTREMIERLNMAADTDGIVRMEMGSPEDFFARVDRESLASTDPAPVWRGELYFEMHRGTYTSQAKTKAGNRRAENLLREAEWLSVMAFGTDPAAGYPLARLDRLWKDTLILQFHDILPGSSIAWVHQQAEVEYQRIHSELETLIDEALAVIAATSVVFNPAPVALDGPVMGSIGDGDHAAVGGSLRWASAPAGGFATLGDMPDTIAPVVVEPGSGRNGGRIGNGLIDVTWDASGNLTSVLHCETGRQVLRAGGAGNRLELFDDRPIEYDAWDIEPYYRNRRTVVTEVKSIEVELAVPQMARVRIVRTAGASTFDQTVVIRAGSCRVDIETDVQWHETNTMLKACFDVDVHTDRATAEVQFGHVARSTTQNTTWDLARFEVCAHRWLDLSEPDFGVAVLNDSKYGHDTLDGNLRITLLRSSQFPDPSADVGRHAFTYSLYPHAGDLAHSDVIAQGYLLNMPPRFVNDASKGTASAVSASSAPPVLSDNPGVIIECVKAAEDGSGDLIVRCYESRGARSTATLTFAWPFASLVVTDLLEQPMSPDHPGRLATSATSVGADSVSVELHPFRILTLRVQN